MITYPECNICGWNLVAHTIEELDRCRRKAQEKDVPFAIVRITCPKCGHKEAELTGGTVVLKCFKCRYLWNPEREIA